MRRLLVKSFYKQTQFREVPFRLSLPSMITTFAAISHFAFSESGKQGNSTMAQTHKITIKTLHGLEDVLAKEVRNLGGGDAKALTRAVVVSGDMGFVYKCNLWLRTALRVLVEVGTFKVTNANELYDGIRKIGWEDLFDADKTISIDATVFSDHFNNSLFVAQKAKDAIADRFRDRRSKRPTVDTHNPQVRIQVHIVKGLAWVSLDSSGESLHKRQYRRAVDRAPLSEVLASGILLLSGWDAKSHLFDPMCGSGTFLTEAALMAHNIPPNIFRKTYAFQHWRNYDEELFHFIFDKALDKEEQYTGRLLGWDTNGTALRKAQANAKSALMQDVIELEPHDFLTDEPPEMEGPCTIIMNPPYGEKIAVDVDALYGEIGRRLKFHYQGRSAWIFSGSEEGIHKLGLRYGKRHDLFNGKLPCKLLRYDLYPGSRKGV